MITLHGQIHRASLSDLSLSQPSTAQSDRSRQQRRVWRSACFASLQDPHQKPVVKSVAPPRQAAPPPQPLAVEHSAAYLLRHRNTAQPPVSSRSRDSSDYDEDDASQGNAVQRALRRVDRSLDELEDNPPAYAEALWAVSKSPVGTATSKGITTAAKMGKEAVLMAIPVGKWALHQGFKAAMGAAAAGKKSSKKGRGKE